VHGLPNIVETIDPFIGQPDFIDGGTGQNVILGGDGDDVTVGNLDNDVLAGDYASVVFDAFGHVTSVIRYGSGNDLIARVQESLFSFVRPKDGATVTVEVYRSPTIRPGDVPGEEARVRDYLILPTLAGFEFSSLVRHSDSGPGPSGQSLVNDDGTPRNRQPDESIPLERQEGGNADTPSQGAQPQTGGPDAPRQDGSPSAPPSGEVPDLGTTPAPVLEDETAGRRTPLEFAMAGLLGAQGLHLGRKRTFRAPDVVQASGEHSSGRWVAPGAGGSGATEVLLDRRATPRPATVRRLAPGAVEQTAQKWLDGAFGLQPKVETVNYQSGEKIPARIEWGSSLEAPAGRETK
jgi:hypothetical protein